MFVSSAPDWEDTTVTDFLETKRKEINDRLAELKSAVDEYTRLEAAATALKSISASKNGASIPASRPAGAPRRGPGRPPGSKNAPRRAAKTHRAAAKSSAEQAAKRGPGRRKGSGKRGAEALALIQGQPGITIPELATKMGIKQNYLYRVLPGLKQESKIAKKGRGWHPKAPAAVTT
jgi:hypothetical protein